MLPSAAETASASQRCEISELNLHGLLPCCVRFGTHQSPGEWQHSLPACSLALAGRDSHPLDFIKWFPLLHCRFLHFHAYPSATQRSLVTACTLAKSASDPLHQRLQQLRCLHCRSDCYRVERTSSRAGLPPLWTSTFFTAHPVRALIQDFRLRKSLCQARASAGRPEGDDDEEDLHWDSER